MREDKAPPGADADLVQSIQGGHTEAEAALYEKYSARVYYLALRESRCHADAEDVRAETFLRVLRAIRNNHVRSSAALASFILSTARNVLHELFRRRQTEQRAAADPADEPALPSQEELFLDSGVRRAIQQTILRLRPREQDVLRMHYYEELPKDEIARRTGIAAERIRLVKSRALKRFREAYLHVCAQNRGNYLDTKAGAKLT